MPKMVLTLKGKKKLMGKIALAKIIIENGEYEITHIKISSSLTTLDQISKTLPDGAYTTFRTYDHHKVIQIENHFLRLEETARLANFPFSFEHAALRKALREFISAAGDNEIRVRITLDLQEAPGIFYFSMEDLHTPAPNEYLEGVKVVTKDVSRKNPKAKLTDFISIANQVRKTIPEDVNEALLIGADGRFLEGLSSNFFAICNGVIWTAEKGVLSGITRAIAIEEGQKLGIPFKYEGFPFSEIASLKEAFITSTSRSILPIRQINDTLIGDGKPGKITGSMMNAYAKRIHSDVESL